METSLDQEYEAAQRKLEDLEKRKKWQMELDLASDALKTLRELRLKERLEHIEQLDNAQQQLNERFAVLEKAVLEEIGERKAHRQKETETLELLQKYLKSWV